MKGIIIIIIISIELISHEVLNSTYIRILKQIYHSLLLSSLFYDHVIIILMDFELYEE